MKRVVKQPRVIIKEGIAKIHELERNLKKFKHSKGYCAESYDCLNKPPNGRWGCDSCLADVDPRR